MQSQLSGVSSSSVPNFSQEVHQLYSALKSATGSSAITVVLTLVEVDQLPLLPQSSCVLNFTSSRDVPLVIFEQFRVIELVGVVIIERRLVAILRLLQLLRDTADRAREHSSDISERVPTRSTTRVQSPMPKRISAFLYPTFLFAALYSTASGSRTYAGSMYETA